MRNDNINLSLLVICLAVKESKYLDKEELQGLLSILPHKKMCSDSNLNCLTKTANEESQICLC